MGEGIRNAKVVSLLKKPGDPVALDDQLCEVETDKAVYPIQSSFAGVMGEWKTKIGDTVDIGQELGTLFAGDESLADQFEAAAEVSAKRQPVEAAVSAAGPGDGDRGRIAPETVLKKPGSPHRRLQQSSQRFRPRSPANLVVLFLPTCKSVRAGTQFEMLAS